MNYSKIGRLNPFEDFDIFTPIGGVNNTRNGGINSGGGIYVSGGIYISPNSQTTEPVCNCITYPCFCAGDTLDETLKNIIPTKQPPRQKPSIIPVNANKSVAGGMLPVANPNILTSILDKAKQNPTLALGAAGVAAYLLLRK